MNGFNCSKTRLPALVLGAFIGMMLISARVTAEPRFSPADAKLDTTRPVFTIKETHRHAQVANQPGIVGIDMLIYKGQYPLIQMVFPGTPAYREGLRPGDTIIAVDGIQAVGKTRPQVDAMISDIPGQEILFTIARDGQLQQVRLTVAPLDALPSGIRGAFKP